LLYIFLFFPLDVYVLWEININKLLKRNLWKPFRGIRTNKQTYCYFSLNDRGRSNSLHSSLTFNTVTCKQPHW